MSEAEKKYRCWSIQLFVRQRTNPEGDGGHRINPKTLNFKRVAGTRTPTRRSRRSWQPPRWVPRQPSWCRLWRLPSPAAWCTWTMASTPWPWPWTASLWSRKSSRRVPRAVVPPLREHERDRELCVALVLLFLTGTSKQPFESGRVVAGATCKPQTAAAF